MLVSFQVELLRDTCPPDRIPARGNTFQISTKRVVGADLSITCPPRQGTLSGGQVTPPIYRLSQRADKSASTDDCIQFVHLLFRFRYLKCIDRKENPVWGTGIPYCSVTGI